MHSGEAAGQAAMSEPERTVCAMQLTRTQIVTTAIGLIERDGADATSMVRLAAELGCSLMTLYHHVPAKSALLEDVAAEVLAGIRRPQRGGSWPEQIRTQALAVRQAVGGRPWCAILLAAAPRRALGAARQAEATLAALHTAGFSGPEAARIARVLAAYLIGSLLCQPGALPGLSSDDDQTRGRPRLRQAEFPQLTRLLAAPPSADPAADFDFGLGLLLTAIAARAPAGV